MEEETIEENYGYVEQLVEISFSLSRRKRWIISSREDTGIFKNVFSGVKRLVKKRKR